MSRLRVLGLISLISFSLLVSVVFAQSQTNCNVAWPQFGVVRCGIDTDSQPLYNQVQYVHNNTYSIATYQCSGRCDIENSGSITNGFSCPALQSQKWEIYRSGTLIATSGGFLGVGGFSGFPTEFNDKDSITIKSWCDYYIGTSKVNDNAYVAVKVWNKYLYETTPDWPSHKVESTVGCAPQSWITNYLGSSVSSGSIPNSWVDSTGSVKDTLSAHPNVQSNLQNLPTVMPINADYSYFYKWVIVPDINVVYGKDGTPSGYCGGSTGNRKLFSYSQVTTIGGNCYLIPSSVQRTVECCSNEDCKWNPSKPTCDTTSFSCSDKKPCNSDVECQVPGQTASCTNKQETVWKCDMTQKWYPYAGTCVQSTKSVACCSDNECSSDKYCDKNKGCLDKIANVDCPQGKCCKPGGRYKEQSCPSNMSCCPSPDPIIGDCAQTCEPPKPGLVNILNGLNITLRADGNLDVSAGIAGIPIKVTIGKDYKAVQDSSPLALGPILGLVIKFLPVIISML